MQEFIVLASLTPSQFGHKFFGSLSPREPCHSPTEKHEIMKQDEHHEQKRKKQPKPKNVRPAMGRNRIAQTTKPKRRRKPMSENKQKITEEMKTLTLHENPTQLPSTLENDKTYNKASFK